MDGAVTNGGTDVNDDGARVPPRMPRMPAGGRVRLVGATRPLALEELAARQRHERFGHEHDLLVWRSGSDVEQGARPDQVEPRGWVP